MKKYYFAVAIFFLILFHIPNVFAAEPIMISISSDIDKVIFDGKWSFMTEWKHSSLNTLSYDNGTTLELRTAFQGNFVYVFIDDIDTNQWNKGSDRAIVCFDKNNDKNFTADANDYCFMNILSGNTPITLQGGSALSFTSNFKKVPNPDGFMAVASISDQNDRYTSVPHPGYEFRIPTAVIGRSADYGFYVYVYHSLTNKFYSYPQDVTPDSPVGIPSPSKWGDLVSPDASLPEFQWPVLPFLIAVVTAIWFTRKEHIF